MRAPARAAAEVLQRVGLDERDVEAGLVAPFARALHEVIAEVDGEPAPVTQAECEALAAHAAAHWIRSLPPDRRPSLVRGLDAGLLRSASHAAAATPPAGLADLTDLVRLHTERTRRPLPAPTLGRLLLAAAGIAAVEPSDGAVDEAERVVADVRRSLRSRWASSQPWVRETLAWIRSGTDNPGRGAAS